MTKKPSKVRKMKAWAVVHKFTGNLGNQLFDSEEEAIKYCNFPMCYFEIIPVQIQWRVR